MGLIGRRHSHVGRGHFHIYTTEFAAHVSKQVLGEKGFRSPYEGQKYFLSLVATSGRTTLEFSSNARGILSSFIMRLYVVRYLKFVELQCSLLLAEGV